MATMLPPSARMGQIQNSAREDREIQANHEATLKALQEQYPMPPAPVVPVAAPVEIVPEVPVTAPIEVAPEVPVTAPVEVAPEVPVTAPVEVAPALVFNDKMTRRELLDLATSLGLTLDPAATKAIILAELTNFTKAN